MSPGQQRKVGETIDGWSLVELLGTGGNAEVWKAESSNCEPVALKILHVTNPDKEPYMRFKAEIGVLTSLGTFAGVLPILASRIPDRPSKSAPAWLAMPVAVPIRKALGDQPRLVKTVEAIATVASTLAALCSEHQIYHRDVKPANLFRLADQWCIGDFGLVDYPTKEGLTAPGRWIGPRYYLAPELLSDPDGAESGPADVHGLAKTLWVLATGQKYPIPGPLLQVWEGCQISSYIADERVHMIEALVEKATDNDPRLRPSMQAFAEELSAWLEQPATPLEAVPMPELRSRMSPLIERQRKRKELRERCREHVDTLVEELVERLAPLAQSLQEGTGLEAVVSKDRLISNLPEIQEHLRRPDYLTYAVAQFHVATLERLGEGNNFITLLGGLSITGTRKGMLYITGAYAVHLGAGQPTAICLKTEKAELDSAREEQALDTILVWLRSKLPNAVSDFAAVLEDRDPQEEIL